MSQKSKRVPVQMNSTQKTMGLGERMDEAERALMGLIEGLNRKFEFYDTLVDTITALKQLVGNDQVNNLVSTTRLEKIAAKSNSEKEALNKAIADGYMTVGETVTENSMIVGVEYDASGGLVGVGRSQLLYKQIDPQYTSQILGNPVGTSFTIPKTGGRFEVTEIYHVNETKARELMEAKAQAQAVAAAAQAAELAANEEKADTTTLANSNV